MLLLQFASIPKRNKGDYWRLVCRDQPLMGTPTPRNASDKDRACSNGKWGSGPAISSKLAPAIFCASRLEPRRHQRREVVSHARTTKRPNDVAPSALGRRDAGETPALRLGLKFSDCPVVDPFGGLENPGRRAAPGGVVPT